MFPLRDVLVAENRSLARRQTFKWKRLVLTFTGGDIVALSIYY